MWPIQVDLTFLTRDGSALNDRDVIDGFLVAFYYFLRNLPKTIRFARTQAGVGGIASVDALHSSIRA